MSTSRKHWTVHRNAEGYWTPVWEQEGGHLCYDFKREQAQRKADAMNAEETDWTRQKYAPKQEAT